MKRHHDTGIKVYWLIIAIVCLIMTAGTLFGQTVEHKFQVRLPGGAIAKYAQPTPFRGGWGLTKSNVDYITTLYSSTDEEPTGTLEKWYRKIDEQPETSYLYDLVEFCQAFPSAEIIWAVNLYGSPEEAMEPIDFMLDHDIPLVAVEMGNESYSQCYKLFEVYDPVTKATMAFEYYLERMEPIRAMCIERGLTIYHPAAPWNDRSDHMTWNGELADYTFITGDGICKHFYTDGRRLSGLQEPVDTVLTLQQIADYEFEEFQDFKDFFNGSSDFIVTEANTQPAQLIGDTELNAVFIDSLISKGKREFKYFAIHNGVAPERYGIVYGVKEQKRATHYYPWADHVRSGTGNVGVNGAGFFENRTEQSDTWLREAITGPVVDDGGDPDPEPECDKKCTKKGFGAWLWRLFNPNSCVEC